MTCPDRKLTEATTMELVDELRKRDNVISRRIEEVETEILLVDGPSVVVTVPMEEESA